MLKNLFYRRRWGLGILALTAGLISQGRLIASEARFHSKVQPVLEKHCVKCHGPEKQKGKLRLDTLSTDLSGGPDVIKRWLEVRSALVYEEMPPEDEPALSEEDRRAVLEWLNSAIEQAAQEQRGENGRVVVRRLNRVEYQNTMRDLFDLDLTYAADLPPDGVSPDGMLNNGSSLQMSGHQLEYYLKAAREALDQVIITTPEPEVFTHRFEKSTEGRWLNKIKPDNRVGKGREFLARIQKDYPERGVFRLRIRARAEFPEPRGPLPRMNVWVGYRPDTLVDRKLLAALDLTKEGSQDYEFTGRLENFPLPVRGQGKYPGLVISVSNEVANLMIESLEFTGPIFDSWPPLPHRRILHDSSTRSSSESDYAREVVERFLPRSWRRPVAKGEVDRFVEFFSEQREATPTFEEAIKETLAMALISPAFLYILEGNSEEPRPLNPHELASRLSYFLWSSMPDEALRATATKGDLQKPDELARQVARMIRDDRSWNLIEQFSTQWLDLKAVDRLAIDQKLHPGFEPALAGEMRRETQEFFGEILRNDLSGRHFIDSDFLMLNNRLARHYGIEGVYGGEFRRVALTGEHAARRGGLLTQASVLLGNSTGRDSNVVKRAVFLRKRLLNDPPAPPPPNVPELKTADPNFARLPIREQLRAHLEDPACADCHRGIDPWGLAMEEFDAIGHWREKIVRPIPGKPPIELPVDARTTLPDGREINGMIELKSYLWEHRREQFARAFVEKLMSYALGRSLEFHDDAEISALTKEFLENDLRVGQLVQSIVASAMFQNK